MSEPLSLDENLFMLRGVIGDLRRGFSRAVDTERWVSDTQAFIDRIREQAQRANVSAATRTGSVVAEGVTAGETALRALASEFVRYWTTDRSPDGCGMCGGIPHSTTCYVGRMAKLIGSETK